MVDQIAEDLVVAEMTREALALDCVARPRIPEFDDGEPQQPYFLRAQSAAADDEAAQVELVAFAIREWPVRSAPSHALTLQNCLSTDFGQGSREGFDNVRVVRRVEVD